MAKHKLEKYEFALTQDRVETLMEDCGFRSMKQLFNRALDIMDWIKKKKKEGCRVGCIDLDGNFTELQI